ncbi:MAG: polymer-forming cytoskeletal protein [Polyangiales bacterium]
MGSRIEAGLTIEGSVRGDGELVVAGRLRGALTLQGTLVVEEGGSVEAEVEANTVVVSGLLSGSVLAHESLRIESGGCVDARVRATRLAVADGAIFRGELQAQASARPAIASGRPARVAVEVEAPRTLESPSRAPAKPRGRAFSAPVAEVSEAPPPAAPQRRPTASPGGAPPRMPALPKGRTTFGGRE